MHIIAAKPVSRNTVLNFGPYMYDSFPFFQSEAIYDRTAYLSDNPLIFSGTFGRKRSEHWSNTCATAGQQNSEDILRRHVRKPKRSSFCRAAWNRTISSIPAIGRSSVSLERTSPVPDGITYDMLLRLQEAEITDIFNQILDEKAGTRKLDHPSLQCSRSISFERGSRAMLGSVSTRLKTTETPSFRERCS